MRSRRGRRAAGGPGRSEGADRVVIAACSERVNHDVFSPASLGVDMVGRVNIREMVAWSKPPGEEETQLLAEDYVRMGIARLQWSASPSARNGSSTWRCSSSAPASPA